MEFKICKRFTSGVPSGQQSSAWVGTKKAKKHEKLKVAGQVCKVPIGPH